MNVAIIPARGGSKRILGKNIKPFMGKPIITYSIAAAIDSGLFDRVIVSTDSEEIAEVARKAGAEVPFMRPAELSDDKTVLAPVVLHALTWLKDQGFNPKYACCILSTAPFIRVVDLKQGYELLSEKKVGSVVSITSFAFPIFRSFKVAADGYLEMFWPEHELTLSNDLPEAYHDAGQFYWLDCERFYKDTRMYAKDALPVVLPRYLVQDIDTPEDWETAEFMYQAVMASHSS